MTRPIGPIDAAVDSHKPSSGGIWLLATATNAEAHKRLLGRKQIRISDISRVLGSCGSFRDMARNRSL